MYFEIKYLEYSISSFEIKSLVKIGGTNVMNKYYYTGFGSPGIGGLYYISFAYNVL